MNSESHPHYWRPGTYGGDVSWRQRQFPANAPAFDWNDPRYSKLASGQQGGRNPPRVLTFCLRLSARAGLVFFINLGGMPKTLDGLG